MTVMAMVRLLQVLVGVVAAVGCETDRRVDHLYPDLAALRRQVRRIFEHVIRGLGKVGKHETNARFGALMRKSDIVTTEKSSKSLIRSPSLLPRLHEAFLPE